MPSFCSFVGVALGMVLLLYAFHFKSKIDMKEIVYEHTRRQAEFSVETIRNTCDHPEFRHHFQERCNELERTLLERIRVHPWYEAYSDTAHEEYEEHFRWCVEPILELGMDLVRGAGQMVQTAGSFFGFLGGIMQTLTQWLYILVPFTLLFLVLCLLWRGCKTIARLPYRLVTESWTPLVPLQAPTDPVYTELPAVPYSPPLALEQPSPRVEEIPIENEPIPISYPPPLLGPLPPLPPYSATSFPTWPSNAVSWQTLPHSSSSSSSRLHYTNASAMLDNLRQRTARP